jgi:hypothetical protein
MEDGQDFEPFLASRKQRRQKLRQYGVLSLVEVRKLKLKDITINTASNYWGKESIIANSYKLHVQHNDDNIKIIVMVLITIATQFARIIIDICRFGVNFLAVRMTKNLMCAPAFSYCTFTAPC